MKLKRINLRKRRECEHPDLRAGNKWYLAKTSFGWMTGKLGREWYGLVLSNPMDTVVCHQLDEIKELYEMVSR